MEGMVVGIPQDMADRSGKKIYLTIGFFDDLLPDTMSSHPGLAVVHTPTPHQVPLIYQQHPGEDSLCHLLGCRASNKE